MHVVSEAEGPEMLVSDDRGAAHHVREQDLAQVHLEGWLAVRSNLKAWKGPGFESKYWSQKYVQILWK